MSTRPIARPSSSGSKVRVAITCSCCGNEDSLPYEDPGPQPPILCENCRKEKERTAG